MNVADETCESTIACSVPLLNWSGQVPSRSQSRSGLPILAKYEHLNTIWDHISDNSPTIRGSSRVFWWSSKQGLGTLWCCSVTFLRQFANSVQNTFERDLRCRSFQLWCLWDCSVRHWHCASADQLSEQFQFSHHNSLIDLCCPVECIQGYTWSVNDTGVVQGSTLFCSCSRHLWNVLSFFLASLCRPTHTDKNNRNFRWRYGHSHPETSSPVPTSTRTFSNLLLQKSPGAGWP